MNSQAATARQCEAEFLSAVEANLEAAKQTQFRGSIWLRTQLDDSDRLRAVMASHRNYDRELLKKLPTNRRIAIHGFERRFGFWKRRTGVAVASVLSPLEHYVASDGDEPAPPVDLASLDDYVRELVGAPQIPHVVGVCSPTGFTKDALEAQLDTPTLTVILIEPDGMGGWKTSSANEDLDPRLLKIFDPEGTKQKVERVRQFVDAHSADLLTGGLSLSAVSRETGLLESVVREGFAAVSKQDEELRLSEHDGELLMYRGAPVQAQENKRMGMIDRIKQIFAGEGDETEKINVLAGRRAALTGRRDRLYEDIGKLEKKEAELVAEGKATKSQVPRRRLAAQLAQLRKDIARNNTTAGMLNQQINILSTDIHNLTLIQQGEMAQLPATEELTTNAVHAEEMLETLKADAELVGSLETGIEATLSTEEEAAILREFEEADEPPAPVQSDRVADPARAKDTSAAESSVTPAPEREPHVPEPERPRGDAEPS